MTSGEFTSFDINAVVVDREARQRRELRGIDELAESIAKYGLIHPIVVTRDGVLVAGERRFTAVSKLGWTHVPVQFVDELPEEQLRLIELEENIKRVDITWQEQAQAISQYHEARSTVDKEWNASKTADALGIAPSKVSDHLSVAKAMDGNERIANADKFSVARNIVRRDQERKRASVLDTVDEIATGEKVEHAVPLINANFAEWLDEYDGPSFNFIHCDFPYGVNADKHNQGAAKSYGGYEDSADVYWELCDLLGGAMERVVAESAHLMFWFSMDYYAETKKRLEAMDWKVNPFPLVWFKSDNTGILPDPSRGPRRVYETAFMAARGDRKVVQAVGNAVAAPVSKRVHMSEKPRHMLHHFMRMFIDEYSYVLDPTCGSGNAIAVAEQLGATRVLGIERDPEFYELAKEAYHEVQS